ncbi:RNase H domain-containing protein [Trichonephila clavipes]|nr:RNase H domain-containing protein [Trichonephila clavipes]
MTRSVTKSPRVAEQCDVNIHSLTHATQRTTCKGVVEAQCPHVGMVWSRCRQPLTCGVPSQSTNDAECHTELFSRFFLNSVNTHKSEDVYQTVFLSVIRLAKSGFLQTAEVAIKCLSNWGGPQGNKCYGILSGSAVIHLQWIPSHVNLKYNDIADDLAKGGTSMTQKQPPPHLWYLSQGPGSSNSFKGDRRDQTTFARLTMRHLKSLRFSYGAKTFPICTKCNDPEATPQYLLDCVDLVRRYFLRLLEALGAYTNIDPERLNATAPSSAPLFFTRTYRMRGLVQPPSLTRIAGANKEISKAALSLRSRTIHPRLAPLLGGAPSKIIRAFGGVKIWLSPAYPSPWAPTPIIQWPPSDQHTAITSTKAEAAFIRKHNRTPLHLSMSSGLTRFANN